MEHKTRVYSLVMHLILYKAWIWHRFGSEVNLKLPKAVVVLVPFLVPLALGIAVSEVIRLEEKRLHCPSLRGSPPVGV